MLGGALAAGQDDGAAEFAWTMPARYGSVVKDGLIDYPQAAATVPAGPFTIDFHLRPEACARGATRAFAVEGRELAVERLGPDQGVPAGECVLRAGFESEGSYDVELKVERDGDEAKTSQEVVVQDLLVVAIGDSVASGEGNPIRRGLFPTWQDQRCHRSSHAGTAQAAEHLERANGQSSVTFVHLACSGATVPDGLTGPYKGAQRGLFQRPRKLPAQLDELKTIAGAREIDAVLLSVGGNDVGFADIVKFCARLPDCKDQNIKAKTLDLEGKGKLPLKEGVVKTIGRLESRFESVAAALPESVPPERVHLIEYFDATHETATRFCEKIEIPPHEIDRGEAQWAYDDVIVPLNAALGEAAGKHRWRLVPGVADGYRGHGYCAADRWVRQLPESLTQQGLDFKGTLHPNELGHRFTATRMDAIMEPALLPGGKPRKPRSPEEQSEGISDEGVVPAATADGAAADDDDDGDDDDGLGFLPGFLIGAAAAALGAGGIALARRR